MTTDEPMLTTKEVAAYLKLKPTALNQMRYRGEGPTFHKLGSSVRYLKSDIDEWVSASRRTSTAA